MRGGGHPLFFFTFSFKIQNKKLGYQIRLSTPQVPLEASMSLAAITMYYNWLNVFFINKQMRLEIQTN